MIRGIMKEREKRIALYLFISPWLVGFLVFYVFPIIWGFSVSLTNRMAFSVVVKSIGFENYVKILTDPQLLNSFKTTFLFTLAATAVAVITGLCLALLLERPILGRSAFRTLFYFPYMIPLVAVGWIFRIFLDRDAGFLNAILVRVGLMKQSVAWLGLFPRGSIAVLSIWRAGWSMLIFLGGLSTIPDELYDSTAIDGANYWRRLRHMTLPLLSPFIFFQVVVSVIYAMQVFIQPYILNPRPFRPGAGIMNTIPPDETFFVTARAFNAVFTQGRFAYGLAMLWLLFLVILVITIAITRIGRSFVYSEAETGEGP